MIEMMKHRGEPLIEWPKQKTSNSQHEYRFSFYLFSQRVWPPCPQLKSFSNNFAWDVTSGIAKRNPWDHPETPKGILGATLGHLHGQTPKSTKKITFCWAVWELGFDDISLSFPGLVVTCLSSVENVVQMSPTCLQRKANMTGRQLWN